MCYYQGKPAHLDFRLDYGMLSVGNGGPGDYGVVAAVADAVAGAGALVAVPKRTR